MESNHKHIAQTIRQILLGESLTLSVAESVTCGCLQNSFTQMPDANDFFNGGITVCNVGERTRQKNVLSLQTAIKMARQITELFSSSIGVSIAGYDPNTNKEHSEHFAYCAVVMHGEVIASKKIRLSKKKYAQKAYCEQALKLILLALKNIR